MSLNSDPPDDGPLFRAILRSLEERSTSLRKAIKSLLVATTTSFSALQSNSNAQNLVDENLQALSISSSTSKSDVLGGLYNNSLKLVREQARRQRETDLRELTELNSRLRGSYDRLKSLESPKKTFEDASKVYYDAVSKYLSKPESDPIKATLSDSKQLERQSKFEALRIDYYSMVESLVESEEVNTAMWLKVWSGVPEDTSLTTSMSEESRRKNRYLQHSSVARTLSASVTYRDIAAGSGTGTVDSEGESGGESDGGGSRSASGGSGFSQIGGISTSTTRKRRSSIPSFSNESYLKEKEKEPERKRDRLKIFLKHSLGSTSFDSTPRSPTLVEPPRSPPILEPSSSIPFPPSSPPSLSNDRQPIIPLTPKQELASLARKKEGFLWSSTKSISHTASGDGGGHYHKLWCVLSEGQLIEFSNWRTALVVANPPFNLKFATARISRNTDRRFVFEVITQSSRRVYQALNDETVNEWVTAINKSIEAVLNNTSSVRHFDASRLTGSSTPFSLHDFGSTTSLASSSRHHPSTSTSESSYSPPIIQQSTAGALIDRLPSWMAPSTNHISRRTSLSTGGGAGGGKKGLGIGISGTGGGGGNGNGKGLAPSFEVTRVNRTPSPRRFTISNSADSEEISSAGSPQPQSRSGSSIIEANTSTSTASNSTISSTTTHSNTNNTKDNHPIALSEHDQRIEELVFDLVGPILTPEEILNKKLKNAAEIHELAEKDGNSLCAECLKGDSNWTSWNLGIFLCIRCSGIHRSLGTHISKVRSVELDDWNDEQLASMKGGGNDKARAFWEARRPEGLIVDDLSVTSFIKHKYLERLWIPLSSVVFVPIDSPSSPATSGDSIGIASSNSTSTFESSKSIDLLSGVLKAVGIGS